MGCLPLHLPLPWQMVFSQDSFFQPGRNEEASIQMPDRRDDGDVSSKTKTDK